VNKIVNDKQFMITWYVDDLKLSNVNKGEVTKTIEWLKLLGLLRTPRSTPVPWIKDNAILALPDNVLTYVVL
jgi:hypothetical protein